MKLCSEVCNRQGFTFRSAAVKSSNGVNAIVPYEFKLDKNFVLHITNESVVIDSSTPTVMLVSEDSTAGAVQSVQI